MSAWKKRGLIALGVLVALVAAFSAGRFSKPTEVITKVETVEKIVEKVVEKKVEVAAKARAVYVNRVITKEGEVRERIVEREVEKTKAETDTATDKATDTSAKTETITKNDAPRLTVMVLGGYQHGPTVNLIPNVGPFSIGASVTYRFAGPFTAGAVVTSTGGVWAGVGLQF